MRRVPTLDDLQLGSKRVFLRVDMNSPMDPATQQILDDSRIRSVTATISDLSDSKVVLGSHQSRPGKDDFTSLAPHAAVLQRYSNSEIIFVHDILGREAKAAMEKLKEGQVLVLENLRFWAEENVEASPEKQARTIFVRTLAPIFEAYVNDAFATSHRSHPSLVGLPQVLPSCAGRLMIRELDAARHILERPTRPFVLVLGGAKVEDKMLVIERMIQLGRTDKILVGGMLAKLFLKAKGYKLAENEIQDLANPSEWISKARSILRKHGTRIVLPEDVALEWKGERKEIPITDHNGERPFWDIGLATIKKYSRILQDAGTVVAVGPLGVFERNGFDTGTSEVLLRIAGLRAFTVIGGGHLYGLAGILGVDNQFSHVSTAGGAFLSLLAGDTLPAVKVLERVQDPRQGKS